MPKLGPARPVRIMSVAVLALALPLGLSACGSSGGSESSGGSSASGGVTTVKAGKLTNCTHLAYKPFEFNQGGKVVGFDVDMIDLVAKKMGLEQEIVDTAFEQITSGAVFKANKCDLSAAGTTINDKRKEAVLFSQPYFDATQALITKKGTGLNSLASLEGKKIGVQTDTTGQEYVEKNKDANGYTVVVFDDLTTEVNAVKSGRVDAAINDNGVLFDYAKDNPDTEVTAEFATGESYGIAAEKDDPNATKLMEQVDAVIAQAKKDGSYDEIYKKWFGTTPGAKASGSGAPSASASD